MAMRATMRGMMRSMSRRQHGGFTTCTRGFSSDNNTAFLEGGSKTVVRFASYGIHLDQFEACEEYMKGLVKEVRGQPGVKRCEISVCGTGRVGAYYEFTDLDGFKGYMDSDFYAKMVEEFKGQSFFDDAKEPTNYVGVSQPNV